jgi:hypothetical protein
MASRSSATAGCGGCGLIGGVLVLALIGSCLNRLGTNYQTPSSDYQTPSYAPPPPAYSASPSEGFYVHGSLNVRSGPNATASVVRTLNRGDYVYLGPKDSRGWAELREADGRVDGYVYRASPLVRSTAPGVRQVRSGGGGATRRSSSGANGYYTGPRGGCYTYSASGRKRYVDHSYCR